MTQNSPTETLILWADDEIDLLGLHVKFLTEKGYKVITVTNGQDLLEVLRVQSVDIILLDENMPGLSGLETLSQIKRLASQIPVVMITRNEAEDIMEEAIGAQISDYLIKPVHPNQILLAIKKNIDKSRLVSRKSISDFRQEFSGLAGSMSAAGSFSEWEEIYRKLIFWDLDLHALEEKEMYQILLEQLHLANQQFSRFIRQNYVDWFGKTASQQPLLSHDVFRTLLFPLLGKGRKVVVLLMDNFRYDQWLTVLPLFSGRFRVEKDALFCSILPTVTQYARNALFSGLMPAEIVRSYPEYWIEESSDEESHNMFEHQLLQKQMERLGLQYKTGYEKITLSKSGRKIAENWANYRSNDLTVIVCNFSDQVSHSRTEVEMLRELTSDEAAYRSLTRSWFEHSPLMELVRNLARENVTLVVTTDHGSVRVERPEKVIGDRLTSTNLRFKEGRNLNYNPKSVFEVRTPEKIGLPRKNLSSSYIFALANDYFVYPKNYNQFVVHFKDTFQHGGVSMEEMMVPFVVLSPVQS